MPTAAACIDTGPCICDDKQGGQHADEERKRQRVSPGQGQEDRDVARNRGDRGRGDGKDMYG